MFCKCFGMAGCNKNFTEIDTKNLRVGYSMQHIGFSVDSLDKDIRLEY